MSVTTEETQTSGPAPDDQAAADRPHVLRRVGEGVVRVVRDNLMAVVVGLVLLWLIAGPIYYLVRMSLGAGNPVNPGPLTGVNYRSVFQDARTYTVLADTVLYSVGVTAVSLTLAVMGAWLIERTDFPGRNLAWIAMLAPLAIPGVLASVAWILLAAPQSGALNVAIRWFLDLFGVSMARGPLNVYSLAGLIFVEGLRGATTLFLMIVGAFRLMDPAMEDAAALSGASRSQTLRRVTLPLLAPALLAATVYAFLGNLQDFDTPLLLGLPGNVFILPTLIYFVAYIHPTPNWGIAATYAAIFVLVLAVLVVFYYKVIIKNARKFQTIAGKAYRPQRIRLGKWRFVALGGFVVYFLLTIGLPLLILLWTSLLPFYEVPSIDGLSRLSLDNFARLVGDNRMKGAVWNTAVLGVGTATVGIGLAFTVSWAVVRVRVRGAMLMDGMAFVPNAIPTIAIGLGFVILYLSPLANWTKLYGTMSLLVLALVVNYLAFATRLGNGAMTQLSPELEEQAWVTGHGKLWTLMRVTLPLLLPTLVAGWIWIFAHAVRHLTLPLLMGTRRNEVLATRLYEVWALDGDLVYASTIAVVLLAVLLVFAFFARSMIKRGFTAD